jgi:hypothetical protein
VSDTPVRPVYPGAPDSTVVAVPLPTAVRPGETVTLTLDWDARLSTLPRRQGRQGRHYDWAHWYPRIAVRDTGGWQTQALLPQGEFFGEFARYDVTLDVARDQVIGATGVPAEGDPGWRGPDGSAPDAAFMRRNHYPVEPAAALGLLPGQPAAERKRVRWLADRVIHFAWATDPEYRYEPAQWVVMTDDDPTPHQVSIHVLYTPADTAWVGVAARRTVEALRWLERSFGPYPYPQLTNLRRLESGGTEFPMLIMNGSPSEGLIVHEVAHQYLHGILANNEWRDGWLDEGFTSFITNWYHEDQGRADVWRQTLDGMRQWERAGRTQPIAMEGAAFRDPQTYSAMTYSKASLVFRMLRGMVGEETMREITREYFRRHQFTHVTEADFRGVAERVSGRELGWFFHQWLHTTATLDYGIAAARTERMRDGRWRTRVEVVRQGAAWMPVELRVGSATRRLDSRERRQTVEVITAQRPTEAVLDPDEILLDLDPTNNRAAL